MIFARRIYFQKSSSHQVTSEKIYRNFFKWPSKCSSQKMEIFQLRTAYSSKPNFFLFWGQNLRFLRPTLAFFFSKTVRWILMKPVPKWRSERVEQVWFYKTRNYGEIFILGHLAVTYGAATSILLKFQAVSPHRISKISKNCISHFFPQSMFKNVMVSFFWYPLLFFCYKSICRSKIQIFRFFDFFWFFAICSMVCHL